MKPLDLFYIRTRRNPVSMPRSRRMQIRLSENSVGSSGTHNSACERPGSFPVSTIVFATWQSRGSGVFDIRGQLPPEGDRLFRSPTATKVDG